MIGQYLPQTNENATNHGLSWNETIGRDLLRVPSGSQSHLDNASPPLVHQHAWQQTWAIGYWHISPSPSWESIWIGMISQSVGVGSRARNGEKGDLESRKLREIRPCVLQYYLPSITRIVRKRARQREERGKKNGKKSWLSVGVPAHRCSESDPARTSRAGRGKSFPRPEARANHMRPGVATRKNHMSKLCISACAVLA